MPHQSQTELPELTPPNPFADVAAAIQGKPSPTREFELQSINRKLAQAQEGRAQGQEHREIADHRLKQFSAISTIAKVFGTIGTHIDPASKDAMAATLAKEATTDGLPVTDPKFFRALMERPKEMSQFLDSFVQSVQRGDPIIKALQVSSVNITDPEIIKLIGDTFQKHLEQAGQSRTTKSIDTEDVIAFKTSGGKIRGASLPTDFTLSQAKAFIDEQVRITGNKALLVEVSREEGKQQTLNKRLNRLMEENLVKLRTSPLPVDQQNVVRAGMAVHRFASQIRNEFTDEELRKYSGIFHFTPQRLAQLGQEDKKAARLLNLVRNVEQTAFSKGGKQLTELEARIVFGYLPSTQGWSPTEFITNLNSTIENVPSEIDQVFEIARTPVGAGGAKGLLEQPNIPTRTGKKVTIPKGVK